MAVFWKAQKDLDPEVKWHKGLDSPEFALTVKSFSTMYISHFI